jgi:hypothetical protein
MKMPTQIFVAHGSTGSTGTVDIENTSANMGTAKPIDEFDANRRILLRTENPLGRRLRDRSAPFPVDDAPET